MLKSMLNRLDSPALTASELRFWAARAQRNAESRWYWLRQVWIGVTALIGGGMFVYEFFAVIFDFNIWQRIDIRGLQSSGILAFAPVWIAIVFATYAQPQQRARILATQIIARDKTRTNNWELVVLTGVDARSYVRAKWWTIVRMIVPQVLPAAIVRAGITAFGVGEITRVIAHNTMEIYPTGYVTTPSALDILLIGALSVVLTFVSVVGIAAGSLDDAMESPRHGNVWWRWMARGWLSLFEALTTLMIILIVMTLISLVVRDSYMLLLIGMIFWTAMDNGWVVTGQLAVYAFMYAGYLPPAFLFNPLQVLVIVLLSLPLSALRLWMRLRLAERTAQRYQLVPSPKTKDIV